MKRFLCVMLAFILALALLGCSGSAGDSGSSAEKDEYGVDLDLSVLSGNVVYAEVYNMTTAPEKYIGETVKIRGNFSVYIDDSTGAVYYACVIPDATACCSNGIEFTLKDPRKYPDEYPKLGSVITVVGTFGTYYEGANRYCTLTDASLLDS
ncbi:MAG: hypothetical protein IK088_01945 [Lachnospiraceae bacterium]|nr:hypothetical protein [Lachnospiraceae bacterium]